MLPKLNTLHGFIVFGIYSSNENGGALEVEEKKDQDHHSRLCTLDELSSLSKLISLHVHNLERASVGVSRAAALGKKPYLTHLVLNCTPLSYDVEPNASNKSKRERIQQVYEELLPPPCLESLEIDGYFGLEYPKWMMQKNPLLPNLTILHLSTSCTSTTLPPFVLLPQLTVLTIEGAPEVKEIGSSFFLDISDGQCCYHFFRKLIKLTFRNMPKWERWWMLEEVTLLLPRLEMLIVESCPKLISLPEGLECNATALTKVGIRGAHGLETVENLPSSVKELQLIDNPSLVGVSNLPSLEVLEVVGCGNPKDFQYPSSSPDSEPQLRSLLLSDSRMESFPNWLLESGGKNLRFQQLRYLHIEGSTQLLPRCLGGGPYWDLIRKIPNVHVFTPNQSVYISNGSISTEDPFSSHTKMNSTMG